MRKLITIILILFCLSTAAQVNVGVYDITTNEFVLVADTTIKSLKIATGEYSDDTLSVNVHCERMNQNLISLEVMADTINIDMSKLPYDTYLLVITYKRNKIVRKYIDYYVNH